MASRIVCAGDPLIDSYTELVSGSLATYLNCGGALNTYRNLCALLGSERVYLITPEFVPMHQCLKIYRDRGERIFNPLDCRDYYSSKNISFYIDCLKPDILILSDYDRGVLNSFDGNVKHKIPCILVDTKYRSLDNAWLDASKFKIWKCTKQEFDSCFASKFDWIIVTDESNPVKLVSGKSPGISLSTPVPLSPFIKSTIGAGDSFLAGIAAELSFHKTLTTNILLKAIQTAINVSQDVIKMPRTSITRIRLE